MKTYKDICQDYNLDTLARANIDDADLSGYDLAGGDFSGTKFFHTHLYETNFSGANLSRAWFYKSNLCRANFSGANLSGVDLSGLNLSGTNFFDAKLDKPIISFQAGKHFAVYRDHTLSIGCKSHSLEDWLKIGQAQERQPGYCRKDIETYLLFVKLCQQYEDSLC